jgi:hypothetical protein
MIRHLVAWTMSRGSPEQLDAVFEELERLPDEIDEILALSCGRLINDSDLDAVLCVDLADADGLERYRSHPAHQPVLQTLRRTASRIVVADYQVQTPS